MIKRHVVSTLVAQMGVVVMVAKQETVVAVVAKTNVVVIQIIAVLRN